MSVSEIRRPNSKSDVRIEKRTQDFEIGRKNPELDTKSANHTQEFRMMNRGVDLPQSFDDRGYRIPIARCGRHAERLCDRFGLCNLMRHMRTTLVILIFGIMGLFLGGSPQNGGRHGLQTFGKCNCIHRRGK